MRLYIIVVAAFTAISGLSIGIGIRGSQSIGVILGILRLQRQRDLP